MFRKAGEITVCDVLGHEFPRGVVLLFNGNGTNSWRCNEPGQVQADRWFVCDAENPRLCLAQNRSLHFADAGLFLLLKAAELSREWQREIVVVQLDVKKAFDHCGPSSGLQGNETARFEFVFDGLACGNLEWKLHEGMLGNGDVKQSSDEPRTASRSAGISSHLHDDHGMGAARFDKELDFTETGLETGRLHAGCDLLCGRCGVDCCIGVCCRNNGVRSDRKTERGWTDGWCTENTLDEFSEDDGQKHHGGRIGCGVGGRFGVHGIDGVSGREYKTCDRTLNSSSQQMPCQVETCVEFPMAPQIVAVEHHKDYDVAGFLLELECLDDGQGYLDGTPRVLEWEAQTTCDLGWRLQCKPVWYDRLSPCWRVDPETENVDRRNDSLRARALHTMVTELDLTVTNTWMNADTEREFFTRSSWSNPEDSLTQVDFIMTSRKLEVKHVQVLDSDWFNTDHRAVYAVLSLRPKMRYTVKKAANLSGWVPDDSWHDAATATLTDWTNWNKLAPLLVETAKALRKVESKEMSVTEMELKHFC